jgi:hypothetical protein
MLYTSRTGLQTPEVRGYVATSLHGRRRERARVRRVAELEMDAEQLDGLEPDEGGFIPGGKIRWDDFKVLRKNAHRVGQTDKALAAAQQEIAVLKTGLKLSPKQVKGLFAAHEGDITPDALKATAIELGFAEPPEDEESEGDREARTAAQDVQRATAGASPPGGGALLTAQQVNGWTQEKMLRFRSQHPQAWDALLADPTAKVPNPGGAW